MEPAVERVDVGTQQSHGVGPVGQDLRSSLHGCFLRRTSSVSPRPASVSLSDLVQLYAYADKSSLNLSPSRASSIISTRTKTSISTVQDELKDGIDISTSGGTIYRMSLDGRMLNLNCGRSRRSTELDSLPLDGTAHNTSDQGSPNDIRWGYLPSDSTAYNRSFADPIPAKVPRLMPVGGAILNGFPIGRSGGDHQGVSFRDLPRSQPSPRSVMTEGGSALQVWLEHADQVSGLVSRPSLAANRTGSVRDVAATYCSVTPTDSGRKDGSVASTDAEEVAVVYQTIIQEMDANYRSDLEAKDRELREAHEMAAVLARQVVDTKSELLRTKGQIKAMSTPDHIRTRSQESIEAQSFFFPPLKLKHVQTLKGALKRRAEKLKKGMDDDLAWLIGKPTTSSTEDPKAESPKESAAVHREHVEKAPSAWGRQAHS